MTEPSGRVARCEALNRRGGQCRKLVTPPADRCPTHSTARAHAAPPSQPSVDGILTLLSREDVTGQPYGVNGVKPQDTGECGLVDVTGTDGFERWLADGLRAEGVEIGSEYNELLAEGERLMSKTLAENTIRKYTTAFNGFEEWCRSIGASALPARPQTVAAYLLRVTRLGTTNRTARADEAEPDDEGRLAASTVAGVVSAIAMVHRNNGFNAEAGQDPTQDPRIRLLVGAYARAYGKHRKVAHAITLDELGLMCDRCLLPTGLRTRDGLLLALTTHPSIEVNANQLQELTWEMVTLPDEDDPTMPARLDFGGRVGTVWVVPDREHPDICPVRWLRAWLAESGGIGPVFRSPKNPGKPISRQGLADRAATLLAKAHAAPEVSKGQFGRLSTDERRRVVQRLVGPDDLQVRDRAVMTSAWWTGQRAEVIERFDVGDVRFLWHEDALVYFVRRSKTDQYGQGHEVAVSAQPGYVGCPVESLKRWLLQYGTLRGIAPVGVTEPEQVEHVMRVLTAEGAPLFVQLNRGKAGGRLGYDGINDRAKHHANLAGIVAEKNERISSHIYRAGNATALLQAGVSAEEIARHQLRANAQYVNSYYRPSAAVQTNLTRGLAERTRQSQQAADQLEHDVHGNEPQQTERNSGARHGR